ncbi:hypothetical protein QC762_0072590 [Podospora pseudocomata]|uniref:Uncharacterized protein n=1 Tax=Podospora pseudocomata TaxID=2093779 RepID=A0ABR0GH78_9PEZI|nr:hypothetical protein QC762_0072590 [Podospora pseudocomata]
MGPSINNSPAQPMGTNRLWSRGSTTHETLPTLVPIFATSPLASMWRRDRAAPDIENLLCQSLPSNSHTTNARHLLGPEQCRHGGRQIHKVGIKPPDGAWEVPESVFFRRNANAATMDEVGEHLFQTVVESVSCKLQETCMWPQT